MKDSHLADAPALSPVQMDGGSIGDIESNVNLFRGEVIDSLELVSLAGRNDLDVKVAALYSSHVRQAVETWNRDAPTGVLGVGWTMPIQRIATIGKETGSRLDDRFYLMADGGATPLYRTGGRGGHLAFQSRQHLFWEIRFHPNPANPAAEYWEIVKDDGAVYTFGGPGGLQWGVRWGNWIGASVAGGGRRYPKGWCLAAVRNVQGDEIRFEYEHDEVALGGFEQQRYTRASRLAAVLDTYGRRAVFHYRRKTPDEIAPPHLPPGGRHAFQYEYQEKFLDRIELRNEDGAPLGSTHFTYELRDLSGKGKLYTKRYLAQVTRRTSTGRPLPATVFSYWQRGREAANPGALASRLQPTGGRAAYRYQALALTAGSARKEIRAPGRDDRPLVWHGPDYTVVVWHDETARRLDLQVYRWGGNWVGWSTRRSYQQAITDLRVLPEAGHFVLAYFDARLGRYEAFLYRQSDHRFGRWSEHDVRLGADFTEITLAGGSDFVAFYSRTLKAMRLLAWNGLEKRWVESALRVEPADRVSLAGRGNVLVAAFHTDRHTTVRLYHADAEGTWRDAWTRRLEDRVDRELSPPEQLWSLGGSFAAATYATGVRGGELQVNLEIFRWREDFALDDVALFRRRQDESLRNPITAGRVASHVVGNAQYVYRFDGARWQQHEVARPAAGREYGYVYGDDLALALERSGSREEVAGYRYDPYASRWERVDALRAGGEGLRPSVGGEFCLLGRRLYARDPSREWTLVHTLPDDLVAETVADRSPFYIAYESRRDGLCVLFLKDGRPAGTPATLRGQRLHGGSPGPGRDLAGAQAFVTYEGRELDEARILHLYRVVNEGVEEKPVAEVVAQVTADDGFGEVTTDYRYDTATATYDPHGRVAQFSSVETSRGGRRDEHGYTRSIFFNGLSPDFAPGLYPEPDPYNNVRDHFRYCNGKLYQLESFDSAGRCVARSRHDYFAYTRAGENDRIFGAYVRLRRQVQETWCFFFAVGRDLAPALDRGELPAPLSEAFRRRRLPLAAGATVHRRTAGRLWHIRQPAGGREYWLEARQDDIAVFGPVSTTRISDYNGLGQPARQTTLNVDSRGAEEKVITSRRYAWEVYPGMRERRQLHQLAEERVTVERPNGAAVADLTVLTYRSDWPDLGGRAVWLPHKQYSWAGRPGSERFDWARWSGSGEPDPKEWLKTSEITRVNPQGRPVESLDTDRLPTSLLYDRRRRFHVASFTAAGHAGGEASYWGFESYEEPGGWRLPAAADAGAVEAADAAEAPAPAAGGTRITGEVSLTGGRCLLLPGRPEEEAGLTGTFSPRRPELRLVLFAWLRTETGFSPDPQVAGWEITATGQGTRTLRLPLPDTGGEWRHFHAVIDPRALGIGGIRQLVIRLRNRQRGRALWLDHVGFAPVESSVKVKVYDPVTCRPTAEIDPIGNLRRLLYDDAGRQVAEVGAGERPSLLRMRHLWREHADRFARTDPNAVLEIRARSGGLYEGFGTGEGWRSRWRTTGPWRVEDRTLVYTGGAGGRLALAGRGGGTATAVHLLLAPGAPPAGDFGIEIGAVKLARRGGSWSLTGPPAAEAAGTEAGTAAAEAAGAEAGTAAAEAAGTEADTAAPGGPPAAPATPREVLLLVAGRAAMAFADGRLLAARRFGRPAGGAVALSAGGRLALAGLLVVRDPVATLTCSDNGDQEIQVQELRGDAVHVRAACHDELGRPAVRTKTARLAGQLLGFRPDFARIDDWHRGVMKGLVAEVFPADQGYPYWRTRYDASPLARTVEEGAPGKENAIDLAVPAARRRTLQHRYEAHVDLPHLADLPPGEHPVHVVRRPDGHEIRSVRDKLGRSVAVLEGAVAGQPLLSRYHFDRRGNLAEAVLPRAFEGRSGGAADAPPYVIRVEHDAFGRQVAKTTPDTDAPYRYVYDRAGRLRFLLDARGAAEGYLHYWRYDAAGRLVEEGVCEAAWDGERLAAGADDRGWLPAPGVWSRRLEYDGDGTDAALLGRLHRVRIRHRPAAAEADVEEWMTYDAEGRVTAKHLRVAEFDAGAVHSLRYRYDDLGNVESLTCDAAAAPAERVEITYGYDGADLERIDARLGDGGERVPVVRYEPDAGGAVGAEVRSPASAHEFRRRFRYDPQGRLVSQEDPYFQLALAYDRAGRVEKATHRFAPIAGADGFVTDYAYGYEYDAVGRLARARNSAGEAWSIGRRQPVAYDLNGNVERIETGGRTTVNTYYPRTNRLATSGGAAARLAYDANGNVERSSAGGARSFRYDRHTQTVLAAQLDGGAVELRYDVKDRRVLKRSGRESRLYLLGLDGRPVVEKVKPAAGAPARQVLVHGPRGLAAVLDGRRLLHVVGDTHGSTRAVVASREVVAAYNYLPHGELMGPAFERPGSGRAVRYLFTGQERDEDLRLYHFKARLYDSALGVFLSRDPLEQLASPYAYVGGDPVNLVDPSGLAAESAGGQATSWWQPLAAGASIVAGLGLIAVGAVITVATLGAGTKALVAGTVVGGALIGGGAAMALYGATHTQNFNPAEFGITVGLGVLAGGVGGLLTLGTAAIPNALVSVLAEVTLTTLVGAADGLITNGVGNALQGQPFFDGWVAPVLMGAGAGLLSGAASGLFGRAQFARGKYRATWAGNRQGRVTIEMTGQGKGLPFGHSEIVFQSGGGVSKRWDYVGFSTLSQGGTSERNLSSSIRLPNAAVTSGNTTAGQLNSLSYDYLLPTFDLLRLSGNDNCTTALLPVLRAAGLEVPWWGRTPGTLVLWAKVAGWTGL